MDSERLRWDNIDDAMMEFFENVPRELWPETVTVNGFARMTVDRKRLCPLDLLLEELDEEYGDPEGDYPIPTDAMKGAEKTFLDVVLSEYTPWACEQVAIKEINVIAWVKANKPEWLEEEIDD